MGGNLPTEMELCAQYGISRHTVREALRRLREAGLISRRRRVGTEVVARTPRSSYRQPTNTLGDLLQYGAQTRLFVLEAKEIACDAALAALLTCRQGTRWLRVDTVRAVPGYWAARPGEVVARANRPGPMDFQPEDSGLTGAPAVEVSPSVSVTVTVTVNAPGVEYRCAAVAPGCGPTSGVPSPKSNV